MPVARAVKDYILAHDLKPGDKLPTHEELRQHLRIGLRRLREGLSILEREGAILRKRKGGTVITEPCISHLSEPVSWHLTRQGCTPRDLLEARVAIESEAAILAAQRRRSRDILELLDTVEQMEELIENSYTFEQFDALDKAFHNAILTATHNPAMQFFASVIDAQFQTQLAGTGPESPADPRQVIQDHRKIVEAIQNQDEKQTLQHLRKHLLPAESPKKKP